MALAQSGQAAPTRYRLDDSVSTVGFSYRIGELDQLGTIAIERADIVVDPHNLAAATVDIVLNVAQVRTPIFLATEALTSPKVLDVARFPTIHFVSTKVTLAKDGRLSGGAYIDGVLTVRDVTRPIRLQAGFFRRPGSAPDDFSQLSVQLTGSLSRSAFGASGFAKLVGDTITLDITAVIIAID